MGIKDRSNNRMQKIMEYGPGQTLDLICQNGKNNSEWAIYPKPRWASREEVTQSTSEDSVSLICLGDGSVGNLYLIPEQYRDNPSHWIMESFGHGSQTVPPLVILVGGAVDSFTCLPPT